MANSPVTYIIVGLLVGAVLAPMAAHQGGTTGGTIAVIDLSGSITGTSTAAMTEQIERARLNDSIDAVVIITNSPGGSASQSESLYLATKRLAEAKPVVTAVDQMAASGAYYAITPSDHIYAKPASFVGSIGVFTQMPSQIEPTDIIISSGPNKLSGGGERDWFYLTEQVRRAFARAVETNRGDDLTMAESEWTSGALFTGATAVEGGLVDEIGGRGAAVSKAAELAGVDSYRIHVMRSDQPRIQFLTRQNYLASDTQNKQLVSARLLLGPPGDSPTVPTTYMLPPTLVRGSLDDEYLVYAPAGNRTPRIIGPNESTSPTEVTGNATDAR